MYGQDIERMLKSIEDIKDITYDKLYAFANENSYQLTHMAKHNPPCECEPGASTYSLNDTPSMFSLTRSSDITKWMSTCSEFKEEVSKAYKDYGDELYSNSGKMKIKANGFTDETTRNGIGLISGCVSCFAGRHITLTYPALLTDNGDMASAGFGRLEWPGWDGIQPADILVLPDQAVIFMKDNGDTISAYSFESLEFGLDDSVSDIDKVDYQMVWRLGEEEDKDDDKDPEEETGNFDCFPLEKPYPITNPMPDIMKEYNKLDPDIEKISTMGDNLYTDTDTFNNSIGSPYKEIDSLKNVINKANTYASKNSPFKYVSQKSSMLSLLNTIIEYCNDTKFSLMINHQYIQQGFDHNYNNDEPSITWRYSIDDDTIGNLTQEYDENVNIHKDNDYDIY